MNTHSSYRLPSLVPVIVLGNAYCFLRRYGLALIAALALLVAIPLYAEAGSNIKQKDTGGTVWEDADGNQVPVGTAGLSVYIEDISEASTAYIVTHKAGNIVKIYSVIVAAVTSGDAVLDFGRVEQQTASGVFQSISSSKTGNAPEGGIITITGHTTSDGSTTGDVDSIVFTVGLDPTLAVSQGQAIWIHSDGGSTNAVSAFITIIIE